VTTAARSWEELIDTVELPFSFFKGFFASSKRWNFWIRLCRFDRPPL
jgi:hypothetical protein